MSNVDQPYIDVLTTFPNGVLGTQVKSEEFYNPKTSEATKTKVQGTTPIAACYQHFTDFAENYFPGSFVAEFVTEKSAADNLELDDYQSIISAGNWEQCMGPILGQIAKKLREPLLEHVTRAFLLI
jgi:hypothetical protein